MAYRARRSRRDRRRRRHPASKYKKRLRSRHTVAKIAQAVVNHNAEVKYQDQSTVAYPANVMTHNVWTQLFDNLTMTRQGVENQPATNFAQNRIGSSIRPMKLWIKGLIQLSGLASGFPVTKLLVRLLIVRRPMSQTVGGTAPALPQGLPSAPAQTSQTNINTFPNNFLANIDMRQNTVCYDKVHAIKVDSLTQSNAAPDYPTRGNSISSTFNINLDMNKLTRGNVEYSFRELVTPSGTNLPKKYAFQMYCIPWASSDYDPAYEGTVNIGSIIAQSRLYFRDG